MASGKVKFFNEDRGFGFISSDGGPDVFFHISALKKSGIIEVDEGERLVFDTEPSKKIGKGPQAVNIKRA